MMNFHVDETLCTRCDRCVKDCPVRIIERNGDNCPSIIAAEAGDCMRCQHCLAVCPVGAVSIWARSPADSTPLATENLPTLRAMECLVRGRRSVRNYQDRNVDPPLLQRLLKTLANAPTGVNRQELTFHVIDDRDVMARFRERAMGQLRDAIAAGTLPQPFAAAKRLVSAYDDEGRDLVFRGAPHALFVAAPADAPCPPQDVALALAYFELLAQSAGLGTVWCGLLSVVLGAQPQLKTELGIPADHVHYQMLFGYPAVRYARTVQRDDGAVIRRVAL